MRLPVQYKVSEAIDYLDGHFDETVCVDGRILKAEVAKSNAAPRSKHPAHGYSKGAGRASVTTADATAVSLRPRPPDRPPTDEERLAAAATADAFELESPEHKPAEDPIGSLPSRVIPQQALPQPTTPVNLLPQEKKKGQKPEEKKDEKKCAKKVEQPEEKSPDKPEPRKRRGHEKDKKRKERRAYLEQTSESSSDESRTTRKLRAKVRDAVKLISFLEMSLRTYKDSRAKHEQQLEDHRRAKRARSSRGGI